MAEPVAELTAEVVFNVKGTEEVTKASKKVVAETESGGKQMVSAWRNVEKQIKSLVNIKNTMLLGAIGAVIANTAKAEQRQAQLALALRNTGHAAGFSAGEINDMAESMAGVVTKGKMQEAATQLLGFTNVVGDVYPRAMQLVADYAISTGRSIEYSAERMGRWLNEPQKAYYRLAREGVIFTDSQKQAIQAMTAVGDIAGAQAIMLQNLEGSFGGVANAARNTFGGALKALWTQITIVATGKEGSLASLTAAINSVTDALASPEFQKALAGMMLGVKALAVGVGVNLTRALALNAKAFLKASTEAARYSTSLALVGTASKKAAAAVGVANIALRAGSGVLRLLGGPAGLALTVAGGLLMLGKRSKDAAFDLQDFKDQLDGIASSMEAISVYQARQQLEDLSGSFEKARNEADKLEQQAIDAATAQADAQTLYNQAVERGSGNVDIFKKRLGEANSTLNSAIVRWHDAADAVDKASGEIKRLQGIADDAAEEMRRGAKEVSEAYRDMASDLSQAILTVGMELESEKFKALAAHGFITDMTQDEIDSIITMMQNLETAEASVRASLEAQAEAKRQAEAAAKAHRDALEAERLEMERQEQAIMDMIAQLEHSAATFHLNETEINLYEAALLGADQAQLDYIETLSDYLAEQERVREETQKYKDLLNDLRTPEEVRNDTLRETVELLEKMGASQEQLNRAADFALGSVGGPNIGTITGLEQIPSAEAEADNWMEGQLAELEEYRKEYADLNEEWDKREQEIMAKHNAALAKINEARFELGFDAAEDFYGGMLNIASGFVDEQSGIYQALFALEKSVSIARSLVAISTAVALAAESGPFPANLGAMASIIAATGNIVSTIKNTSIELSGQAHDGIDFVPNSGTWNLERGERVVTGKTSAKLDRTLDEVKESQKQGAAGSGDVVVNMYEDSERAGQVNKTMADNQQIIDVFVSNIREDGPVAQALAGTYGLARGGY